MRNTNIQSTAIIVAVICSLFAGFLAPAITAQTMPIKINTQTKLGAVKPVNGIGSGPITCWGMTDTSCYWKQANFPYSRLCAVNWEHRREVDIPAIFKNFDADADDPANYDFYWTDEYIDSVEAVGAKIIYTLGTTPESAKKKMHIHPPADFNKWAKICVNIARHYNEGWANGYHKNIQYWEVWNEPWEPTGWTGTKQQYFELYAATARLFKKEMPNVKIGGFAASNVWDKKYIEDFMKYVQENNLPLDFFSYHCYTKSIRSIRDGAFYCRKQLDLHGFTKTELILDEWNYLPEGIFAMHDAKDDKAIRLRRDRRLEVYGITAASFTAAGLIEMTNLPIDIATYYDAQTTVWWSPFDRYGAVTKPFYPFVAFLQTTSIGERVLAECTAPGIYVLAAASGSELRIMLSNYEGKTDTYPLEITGLDPNARYKYTLHLLDEQHDFDKVEEQADLTHAKLPRSITLHVNSMAMITISMEK